MHALSLTLRAPNLENSFLTCPFNILEILIIAVTGFLKGEGRVGGGDSMCI